MEISNAGFGAYTDSFKKVVDWVNFDIETFSIVILINFSGQSEGQRRGSLPLRACFSRSFKNSGIFNFLIFYFWSSSFFVRLMTREFCVPDRLGWSSGRLNLRD